MTVEYSGDNGIGGAYGTVAPGDLLTGQTSGVTAVLEDFYPDVGANRYIVRWQKTGGTLARGGPLFTAGETLQGPNGSIQIAFIEAYQNMKTFRIFPRNWEPGFDGGYNVYTNVGVNYGNVAVVDARWGTTYETWNETNPAYPLGSGGNYNNHTLMLARQWATDQAVFKASSVPGAKDSWFSWAANNDFKTATVSDTTGEGFATTDQIRRVYQTNQVNGIDPSAIAYWDSLYVDDSWHRVTVTDSAVFGPSQVEIQIPVTWTPTEVTVKARTGSFLTLSGKHLWLVNGDNTPIYLGSFD